VEVDVTLTNLHFWLAGQKKLSIAKSQHKEVHTVQMRRILHKVFLKHTIFFIKHSPCSSCSLPPCGEGGQ